MNAPETITSALSKVIAQVAIKDTCVSETHIQALRRKRFTDDNLAELVGSIKSVGVLQPIVVRPADPKKTGGYEFEIVAGERRFLAAQKAGFDTIPATVTALTDSDVLRVQLIENLQREGLHELEEAEGYEELMKLDDLSADALAEKVGKSRSYIYARLKLLALCPDARKACYDGTISASIALLIARIPVPDLQAQALADITEDWKGDTMSYREAREYVQDEFMLSLKSAPFDIKSARLIPSAGACGPCPKRTGNQPDLFGDVKHADVCTDPACFAAKKTAQIEHLRATAEATGRTVIAGKQAQKIMPSRYGSPKGYVRADDHNYDDPKNRTWKQLLGKHMPEPTLIENPHTQVIEECIPETALKAAFAAAGIDIKPPRPGSATLNDLQKKHQREREIRRRIFMAVHTAQIPTDVETTGLLTNRCAEQLFTRLQHHDRTFLNKLYGWEEKHSHDHKALRARIEAMHHEEIARFILDCLTAGSVSWEGDTSLAEIAGHFGIDVKAIRTEHLAKSRKKTAGTAQPAKKKPAAGKTTARSNAK